MKTQEEIVIKAKAYAESIGNEDGTSAYDYVMGYTQCQEDMARKEIQPEDIWNKESQDKIKEHILNHANNQSSKDILETELAARKYAEEDMSDKKYTEEDMLNASKYGYEFRDTTSFPEHKFEDSCIRNTKQWIYSLNKQD